jgi:predicted metalloprotease with PDZ domain
MNASSLFLNASDPSPRLPAASCPPWVRRRSALVAILGTIALSLALDPIARAAGKDPVGYVVDLREPGTHLVRVTMTIPDAGPGTEIQFPTWNATYQIRDFVRNVQELHARCDGEPRELERLDLNTWRSGPTPCARLEIRYAVYASQESVFAAALNEEHAFLNFALLLFYLPQERHRPVRMKLDIPAGWRLATLLDEGPSPGEFAAANYDDLVDSPAEAGEFQEYNYHQNGATYRVVVHARPSGYSSRRLLDSLKKITAAETGLMHDVPFSRYTFILHFLERSTGGMEHRNGTAISYAASELQDNWEGFETTVAHEFFHAWNVKRIRPQNLEPVDYIHGNDTRDLWFCEGLASTYQQYVVLRAKLISPQTFYERLAQEIQILQDRPARLSQSVAWAGREAWLEKYADYFRPERSISYYNKGALLGFLLDLAIRNGSGNQRSLDDLFRRLNEDFARRGRFFTPPDLLAIISEIAPRFEGAGQFFSDYVEGTRELDYDKFFAYAGLRLVPETSEQPALGFLSVERFEQPVSVESVEPGSNADKAGLQAGDALLEMDGHALHSLPDLRLSGKKPGGKVNFRVRRNGREFSLNFPVGSRVRTVYRVAEMERPSAEQLRIRQGWLEGTTSRAVDGGAK